MARTFLRLLGFCFILPFATTRRAANSNEVYYLVNCSKCAMTDGNCQYYRSLIAYYPNESKSAGGQLPAAISAATGLLNWEGNTILGTLSPANDPDFSATIDSNALNATTYYIVGTGKTETRKLPHCDCCFPGIC